MFSESSWSFPISIPTFAVAFTCGLWLCNGVLAFTKLTASASKITKEREKRFIIHISNGYGYKVGGRYGYVYG